MFNPRAWQNKALNNAKNIEFLIEENALLKPKGKKDWKKLSTSSFKLGLAREVWKSRLQWWPKILLLQNRLRRRHWHCYQRQTQGLVHRNIMQITKNFYRLPRLVQKKSNSSLDNSVDCLFRTLQIHWSILHIKNRNFFITILWPQIGLDGNALMILWESWSHENGGKDKIVEVDEALLGKKHG